MALSNLIIRRAGSGASALIPPPALIGRAAIGSSTTSTVNATFNSPSLTVQHEKPNIFSQYRPLNHRFSSAADQKNAADCSKSVYTIGHWDTYPFKLHKSWNLFVFGYEDEDCYEDDDCGNTYIQDFDGSPGHVYVMIDPTSEPNLSVHFNITASSPGEIVIESMDARDGLNFSSEYVEWPEFKNLSEPLQRALYNFLEIRGINLLLAGRGLFLNNIIKL